MLEWEISGCPWKACLFYSTHEVLILSHVTQVWHIVVRGESDGSRFGEDFEPLLQLLPLVTIIVIVGAMRFVAELPMLTRVKLVVFRVILLLLPAMALVTLILIGTAILVLVYELPWAPICALVSLIDIELRLASEVLPVVGKDTLISLVIVFVVGAPHSLEVKHVEVWVVIESVYQLHGDLRLRMCERTVVSILTLSGLVNVGATKLGLILIRMIELFYPVMSLLALFSFVTFSPFSYAYTHLWLVWSKWSPLVLLLVVIVRAPFQVMAVGVYLTWSYFKEC